MNIHLSESDFMMIAGLLPNAGETFRGSNLPCIIIIDNRNNSSDEYHFFSLKMGCDLD